MLLPQIVMFGDDLFRSTPVDTSGLNEDLGIFFGLVDVTLAIWAVVILVQGVRLLQSFSMGRALANIVLPGALLIGAIVAVAGFHKML